MPPITNKISAVPHNQSHRLLEKTWTRHNVDSVRFQCWYSDFRTILKLLQYKESRFHREHMPCVKQLDSLRSSSIGIKTRTNKITPHTSEEARRLSHPLDETPHIGSEEARNPHMGSRARWYFLFHLHGQPVRASC